jgi:hypothetical protein
MIPSSSPWIVGVDPGAKATGVVVRAGDELAHGTTAVRHRGETVEEYAIGVVQLIAAITGRFEGVLDGCPLVAIEAVVAPSVWNNGDRVVLHRQSVKDSAQSMVTLRDGRPLNGSKSSGFGPGTTVKDSWMPTQARCAPIEEKARSRTDSGKCAAPGTWPEPSC